MRVSEINCHPFQIGRYLWMHNGIIEGFGQIKRRLRESLPDRLYNTIEGTTDSEHAFAVFLNLLGDPEMTHSTNEIGQALIETVHQLERWTADTKSAAPSYYIFAVTDGRSVAAIRYVSDPAMEPASLYYSARGKYQCVEGKCQFVDCQECERSVVIASERLNENDSDWIRVAPNHVLTVNEDLKTQVTLMEIERHGSRVETSLYRRGRQSNGEFHTR
jgi:predicted glutamine amidotransferase